MNAAVAAVLVALAAAPAAARTITVSSVEGADFKTPREALNAAQSGDRIVASDIGKIGAKLQKLKGELVVIECLPGSAALKAGLTEGDRIDAANGVPLAELSVPEAVAKLAGRPGSRVTLTIHSKEDPTPRPVVVTRLAASFVVMDEQSKAEIAAALGDAEYGSMNGRLAAAPSAAPGSAWDGENLAGSSHPALTRRAKVKHVSDEEAARELLP